MQKHGSVTPEKLESALKLASVRVIEPKKR